jgi:hypothetical protein
LRADADHSAPSLEKLWGSDVIGENEFALTLKLSLTLTVGFSQLTRSKLILDISWVMGYIRTYEFPGNQRKKKSP